MRITPIIASIFSLLLSLTAFGQPSPINRRAFALAGLASGETVINNPTNIPGLLYWWVASDITGTNVTTGQVTNWIDRIQSKPATNVLTGTFVAPYFVSPNLVRGYRTNALYMDPALPVFFSPSNTTYAVMLIGNQRQSAVTGAFLSNTNLSSILNVTAAKQLRWLAENLGARADNVAFDFVYAPSAVSTNMIYTNGIPCFTNTQQGPIYTVQSFYIGLFGDIYELAIWTNSNAFSTNAISGLHKYATNTYSGAGISP